MLITVAMGEAKISNDTILSDGFGPCMFFLLDFIHNAQSMCYLEHFSYDFDLQDLSEMEILGLILQGICKNLINNFGTDSQPSNNMHNATHLNSFQLLVGGGALDEIYLIVKACDLLNQETNETIIQLLNNENEVYLYQQLLNRVTILKPVSKNLLDDEEDVGKVF